MGVVVAAEPHFFIRGVDTIALQRRNREQVFSPYLLVMGHLMETVERFMRDQYNDDRVIVFADEHHADSDARAQLRLARENPIPGKVHVELSHFFDAAYYGPSEHSRLLQAVDLCTYFYQRSRYASEARDRWKQRYVEAIGAQVMSLTRHQHVWAP